MRKVGELATVSTFSHHYYKWETRIFRQVKGGGIGLRGTGCLARHTMDHFVEKFIGNLQSQGIDLLLLSKYVDDILIISDNLGIGHIWRDGHLVWQKEWEEEDRNLGRLPEDITLGVYMDAANEVMGCLEFTGEVSKNGEPIPCLDTQLWAAKMENDGPWFRGDSRTERTPGHERQEGEGQVIMYKFYRKPMRNKMTMLKRSAQPENMKVATMSSEIVRRLKTTSEFLSKDTFCDILETFMDELAAMGYGLEWRK